MHTKKQGVHLNTVSKRLRKPTLFTSLSQYLQTLEDLKVKTTFKSEGSTNFSLLVLYSSRVDHHDSWIRSMSPKE